MKLTLEKSEGFRLVVTALLAAGLLAAHMCTQHHNFGVVEGYFYWLCRILIEAMIFIAVLLAVEKYLKPFLPVWLVYVLAVLVSLVPFTLAITMLDLIIGLPELGFNGDTSTAPDEKVVAFGLEILYLLDNHIFLSLLLLMPRFLITVGDVQPAEPVPENNGIAPLESDVIQQVTDPNNAMSTFFDSLEPALAGHVCSMEAQEHYILINTTEESRMILHRFSDAVRHTPATLGMRVHRSHWVAHSAVQEIVVEGQSMKLRLIGDKLVPVSRTFRALVESRYSAAQEL